MADEQHRGLSGAAKDHTVHVEVFPRAPVVEAILSFRYPLLDNLQDSIQLLAKDIVEEYPHVEKRDSGYRFKSADGRHVIRLSKTAFSFHRLQPYSQWRDLAAGAQTAWASVRRRYEPEYVAGVSLRYLNKIPLPLPPGGDMADFITLCPQVPASIDTGFSEYLLRLVLEDLTVPARAEITQIVGAEKAQPWTLNFDIDVTSDDEEYAPDSAELWEQVARLREYKNRLFFSSITDKCRELFR
jgi:uncharacterized protein (TIGR04255 family)